MGYKLSFTIPTYNRADYLPELLDSIIDQLSDELKGHVEICISDNASTDNTDEIIDRYKQKYEHITYFKHEENQGADLNYLKSVEIASGEFCWFMGSDDALKPGALAKIFDEIKEDHDIYLCSRTCCDIKMVPGDDQLWLKESVEDQVFDFSNKESFLEYLNNAVSLGALFSFLSSIGFRREKWVQAPYDDSYTGTAYSHVFKLFGFIPQGCTLKYIKESYILCRGENDSFIPEGKLLKRYALDYRGYKMLADDLFEDQDIHKAFLDVMKRQHPEDHLRGVRQGASLQEWLKFEKLLEPYNYERTLFLKYLYIRPFLRPIGKVFQKL
jgi:abequosyltransferase